MANALLTDGVLAVSGNLDFTTVVSLREEGDKQIQRHQGELVIDLTEVESVNTAAMALLLSWFRTAKQAGIDLKYQNVPASLTAIAEMSDLDSLLV